MIVIRNCDVNYDFQILRCIATTLKCFEIPEPRIAALVCLRNMTRTFKMVAVVLKDMSAEIKNLDKTLNLIPLILKSLVQEASIDVQQASIEVLCNVLFPFSVLHKEFLEQGGKEEDDDDDDNGHDWSCFVNSSMSALLNSFLTFRVSFLQVSLYCLNSSSLNFQLFKSQLSRHIRM